MIHFVFIGDGKAKTYCGITAAWVNTAHSWDLVECDACRWAPR